jgi:phospholipid/cholesterol/gamma-HCH transport system substrate-binding protein
MRGSRAELVVGIFALAVLAILSFMTFKVGDFTWRGKQGYIVYAYFKNTAGLDEKTKVKIAGVDAGTIEKIELADGMAKVTIRLYPSVKIYSDAVAFIRSSGLLGDKFLEIKVGSEKPYLKEGDTIKNIEELVDVDDLIRNLSNVSLNLVDFIAELNKTELKDAMKETILNLKDITRDLKGSISENREKLKAILDRVDSITASLEELIEKNKGPVTNTFANLEEFSSSLRSNGPTLVSNLNKAVKELKDMIEKTRPELESIAENTRSTMDSLSAITNKIESGEGTLGKLLTDDKLYNSLTRAAEGVDKTISSIQRFRTYITFKADYLTRLKEGKGYFYVTLQPRKDKYYILGIVGDPIGKIDVTETTTNGTTVRKETVEEDIEFTAQFAKRFKDTTLRVGLTENTFGVGADHFMFNDKLKLTLDAWDFGKDEQGADHPHIRIGADYFLFKNVFISGGVDNILNSNRQGVYIGGGVRFEDEDFKYLFGTVPKIPGQ